MVCLGLRTIHASLIVPSRPPCAATQGAVQMRSGPDGSRSLLAIFGNGFLICFSPRLWNERADVEPDTFRPGAARPLQGEDWPVSPACTGCCTGVRPGGCHPGSCL